MDDLQLLREFRSDLPEPSAGRMELIAEALQREIAAEGQGTSRRRRWIPRVAVIGAAAAACAVALLVLPLGGSQQPASAAGVLREIAAVAAVQPPPEAPKPGQFLYTRSESTYLTSVAPNDKTPEFVFITPKIRETWLGPTGQGKLRLTLGTPRFLRAGDERFYHRLGLDRPRAWRGGPMNLGKDQSLTPGGASKLPTDQAALEKYVEAKVFGVKRNRTADTLSAIRTLLAERFVPPAVRAGLLRMAARLPGIELVGASEDEAGRPGVSVAVDSPNRGTRDELIFDPKTAALLGERETVIPGRGKWEDGVRIGTIVGYSNYLTSAIVESNRERPVGVGVRDTSHAGDILDQNLDVGSEK